MVSRRILRVKVVQALYAFHNSGSDNISSAEKELFLSIERIYDLYLMLMMLPGMLTHEAQLKMEENKAKRLPTEEDLSPNLNLINNRLVAVLNTDVGFKKLISARSLGWDVEKDELRKLLKNFTNSEGYQEYMAIKEPTRDDDVAIWLKFFKRNIPEEEVLISLLQEKSIYWSYDDIDIALSLVVKNLKDFKGDKFRVQPLYKDAKEDKEFVSQLFRITIKEDADYEKLIADKAQNWEVERIAQLDMLLMKMALTELMHFRTIPVKVSLNEYIELSKWFSSPKSSVFINGILDKLVAMLKAENKIVKVGRGLIEK